MAKLIFINPEHAAQVYELTLEKTTVGRAAGNTLVIADASLSAHHCEIHVNGPEVIVRDLGSRNGTLVNGAKLTNQQAQLKSGQTVRFGSVEARLELDGQGEASDDTSSEMTAVHAMGRIMREQKKAREKPLPANATMKHESPGSSQNEDSTATDYTAPQPKSFEHQAPPPGARPAEESSKKAVIVIAVVLVLGLAVLLWFWWGRR